MRCGMPREPEETIQQRVDMRMERQRRVAKGDLEMWAIIDEPALRRPIGSHGVMAAQLMSLANAASGCHVSIQVLPFDVPGIWRSVPRSICSRWTTALIGGLYIEDEAEVRAYGDIWSKLAATALSFEHSAELLSTIAAEHKSRAHDSRSRPL